MYKNIPEGNLLPMLQAGENHTGNPEEYNVIPSNQYAGRIKVV
jgi:hypothetical protein